MKKRKNKFKSSPEIFLGNIPQIEVPEINIQYNRSAAIKFSGKITSSEKVAEFIRQTFHEGSIRLNESFVVLYLNRANKVIGYYRHSYGGITSTVADIRLILSVALKSAAVGIILSHNHPSGELRPSEPDIALTKRLKESAKLMDIAVLDHIIVTNEGHYSLADEGLIGFGSNKKHFKQTKKEKMAKKKKNCRPTFRISQAGHLLRTKGYSSAGSILSVEGKKQKRKRKARGCLSGTETFSLSESQKRNLPKHLQRAILEHHQKAGRIILD